MEDFKNYLSEQAKELISTATQLVNYYTNYDKMEFKKKCQEIQHQNSFNPYFIKSELLNF